MLTKDGLPLKCTFSAKDWAILSSYWHPIAFSSEVANMPVRATLLDLDLVIYRTRTGLTVAADYCPHRGTRMSLGRMVGDDIRCQYHGLTFNGSGACTSIPGSPGQKIPSALKLRTYPVAEKYGLIWTCLAGEARAPIPEWPQLTDPSLQRIKMDVYWDAGAGRHTENFCDLAHFSFTHVKTFGCEARPEIPAYTVQERENGLYFQVTSPQQDGSISLGEPQYADILSEYDVNFPFSSHLTLHFPRGEENIFDIVSPVSSKRSHIFMLKTRDHDLDQPVDEWIAFQVAVNKEDREMVESQVPFALPTDLAKEFHIPSDRFSVAYRKRWRDLGLESQIL